MKKQPYSVVILFNHDGSKVLLQKKDRTAFAGKLNGVGGKIEEGEDPTKGALREIEEETSLRPEDLERFEAIGILSLFHEQCDTANADKYPELWFFTGIVKDENLAKKPDDATEEIGWLMLNGNNPVTDLEIAGDGDLEYFISAGRRLLFGKEAAKR